LSESWKPACSIANTLGPYSGVCPSVNQNMVGLSLGLPLSKVYPTV